MSLIDYEENIASWFMQISKHCILFPKFKVDWKFKQVMDVDPLTNNK